MPEQILGHKVDEELWQRAKEAAAKEGQADNYGYIVSIYKTMAGIEKKSFRYAIQGLDYTEIKSEIDDEKEYYVSGYISTKAIDLVNDVVTDECMDDMVVQLKSNSIKLDFNHETIIEEDLDKNPWGRIVEATRDSRGVFVKCLLNKFHSGFKAMWGSIKSGMIDSFSIAYQPIEKAFKQIQGKAVRLLNRVKLINVALTGTPVNPEAKFEEIAVKSLDYLDNIESKAMDIIQLDVPLFIRLLEFAKEDAKTDMELHVVAENLIKLSQFKPGSMEDYSNITSNLSTAPSAEENKMEEEKETSEEEDEEKKKAETKSEAEHEKSETEEEEAEEEKKKKEAETKAFNDRLSSLEAQVKSLTEENTALKKALAKPEFKSFASSSPDSNKQQNSAKVNPLSLFA